MSAQHKHWRVEHRWPDGWSVDRDETGTTQASAIVDEGGAVVAFAVASTAEPFGEVNTDHDALIAAAPRLLAALERYVAWADSTSTTAGEVKAMRAQMNAAIAAAKGQS